MAEVGVLVSKRSPFSGKVNTRELPITRGDFDLCMEKWQAGASIQDAFWMLDANDREFMLTGITPEEWDATFPEEDDAN